VESDTATKTSALIAKPGTNAVSGAKGNAATIVANPTNNDHKHPLAVARRQKNPPATAGNKSRSMNIALTLSATKSGIAVATR